MNIATILAAIAAKSEGWEDLLIDNWDCILKHYPTHIKLIELLTGQGVNPNATTGQDLLEPLINSVAIGHVISAPGTGTPYALTDTAAAINLGTTDPALVVDQPGTYLLFGQVHLAANGATVVAETAALKIRRTNNTAADVSQVLPVDLPAMTTLTHTLGTFLIPPILYTTANSDDALSLFGNVSAALGAGTIDATAIGTSLLAQRLF